MAVFSGWTMLGRLLVAALALTLVAASPSVAGAKRRVPDGFYGVMWGGGVTQARASAQDDQWGVMAASGVESVRTVFSWPAAQREPHGPIDFYETDSLVARAVRHRIRLLPVVIYTPRWAAQNHRAGGSPPRNPHDYAVYLRALVRRYGPTGTFWRERPELPKRPLREWQIWNEPQLSSYWNVRRGRYGYPGGFGKLLKAAYGAVKRADRGARVVLPGLTSASWRELDLLYRRAHIRRYFDVAALHPFTRQPRNTVRLVRLFRAVMRRNGDFGKRIYVTELTWSAARRRSRLRHWQRFLVTTDRGMARNLAAAFRGLVGAHRRLGIGRVFWATWASGYRSGHDVFDYGGLQRFDGTVFSTRPALRAFQRSARRDEGCAKTRAGSCR
jgi:hypothetical protein